MKTFFEENKALLNSYIKFREIHDTEEISSYRDAKARFPMSSETI